MRIFEDSDSSTAVDPFQDDDGDYGSDKNYDPCGDTSGSSFHIINYRPKSTKTKLQSKTVGDSSQRPNTDSSSESSSDEGDAVRHLRQSSSSSETNWSQSSMNKSSNQSSILNRNVETPYQLYTQEDGSGYDSSTSEEIFPLAKRLKLASAPTMVPPVVAESYNEIIQECSEPEINELSPSLNLSQNRLLGSSNLLQTSPDEIIQEELLPSPNASQNRILDLATLSPISHVVAESYHHEIVQEEPRSSAELPPLSNALHNRPGGLSRPTETTSTEEEWVQTTTSIPEFNFDADTVGVTFSINENTTVTDVFNRLFPPMILDYLIDCTNVYGENMCQTNRPKTRHSRSYSFKPTHRSEMLKFLGLCMLGGQVNVPQKRKLFTLSDSLYYHPIFVSTMSGRRFEQLLRCLYTGPLSAIGKAKITELMDAITRNFRVCYSPEKELSLDESLLLFRGRLSFRQYLKSKKAKYGIKFYELTEASGYVLNILMYTGKDESVEKGKKTEKIVLRLMRPYVLKGHELFMDNYYNSFGLSHKLLDLRTHTNGTLRTNRKGNPKAVMKKKLKKGEHVWVRKNNIYVSKWFDKRTVTMITTRNHPKMINITNRRGQLKRKPAEVVTYNEFMSGIDRADQMVSYYSSPRKCLRWYKKVFFHLLDLAVWNSYFLYRKYKKNNNTKYDFLNFREELIRDLICISPDQKPDLLIKHSKYDNRKINRVVDPGPSSIHLDNGNIGHWPEKIPLPPGSKKKTNYLKCKMCAKNKLRKETGFRCMGCKEKPALCALCFKEWHETANLISSY
ncbi:unnamed protein product [Parnassius mnemosyne]|uniref:PiggyBac transposable element-derived protein domain-containing protein n=1 Tax=Parnassius mnemosyne TaxID=213953 RepID=A0AAV1KCS1_9NEOP